MLVGNYLSPIRRALIAACGALVVSAIPATATGALAADGLPSYYVALGDSLSQGVQPNSSGASVITDQGYVDDLFAIERTQVPGIRLQKLGCPGETTGTMINGGICRYPKGSQLAEAASFLHAHRVALVTIDIGANNVDGCVHLDGTIDGTCLRSGMNAAGTDLVRILTVLRAAAGSGVPIVAMNYYDPFLAAWLAGPVGQALANASVGLALTYNGILDNDFAAFRVPVADVQDAFQTTNFTPLPNGVPTNVAAICTLTWMCTASPPNIHANAAGYALIAQTFAHTVGRLSVPENQD